MGDSLHRAMMESSKMLWICFYIMTDFLLWPTTSPTSRLKTKFQQPTTTPQSGRKWQSTTLLALTELLRSMQEKFGEWSLIMRNFLILIQLLTVKKLHQKFKRNTRCIEFNSKSYNFLHFDEDNELIIDK